MGVRHRRERRNGDADSRLGWDPSPLISRLTSNPLPSQSPLPQRSSSNGGSPGRPGSAYTTATTYR